jgi:type II secretory pathway pseudopilin PulG
MRKVGDKRAQVWVETVIYTLIGLAIMGLILAAAKPRIDAKKDEILIEQAIEAMGNINQKIYEVQRAAGNRRAVDVKVGKGRLSFDLESDQIIWQIDSSMEYSELDVPVSLGTIDLLTTGGDPYKVILTMNYSVDLQFDEQTTGVRDLMQAPNPYSVTIENAGISDTDNRLIIILRETG